MYNTVGVLRHKYFHITSHRIREIGVFMTIGRKIGDFVKSLNAVDEHISSTIWKNIKRPIEWNRLIWKSNKNDYEKLDTYNKITFW